uniref:NADH-quinone oxidoreductase subunit J n=1 Tax=uncultured Thiotrichaceae bacterium TaxID=298394 RepID=A0A6S6U6C7_9GAMM|nr:MAG: NADH-ubiquinone oxidoreductase chain J (EC [uncultured Thiotrichaceae bacterium]
MNFELLLFYLFSAILLLAGISMVTVRNPVYAALSLIVCFFTSAAIWITLEAEFLGIVLVLVYVGAVMVLFLFVIMMLDVNHNHLREGFVKYLPVGLLVAVIIAAEMILVLNSGGFDADKYMQAQRHDADYSNTKALGEVLYQQYLYPFEIAGVILLVAIVAAITLTLRRRPNSKSQNVDQQVRVQRKDRVRLVKMEAEK